ncbi:Ankyrin repeat domain containing protein [Pandoravirus salinus]|uniref:Ankyrin repeat domain containing protein n=1 Tax=Pandoravirus salinus TaxID=1349410 RepID=S4VZL1_9VIRU|nr:ankyrin repeat domain [Pandoravirus salinus]AGO85813.1 Ankyrin repeat domain containing protein [Pandoravirus salinus]
MSAPVVGKRPAHTLSIDAIDADGHCDNAVRSTLRACSGDGVQLYLDDDGDRHGDGARCGRPAKKSRVDPKCWIQILPPEILVAVLALIDDGATFVACRMATRLFWAYSPVDFAVARISPQALIASRAPSDVARAAFERRGDTPCWSLLPLAAETESISTVEWVSAILCDSHPFDDRPYVGSAGAGSSDEADREDGSRARTNRSGNGVDDDRDDTFEHLADFVYRRSRLPSHGAPKDDPLDRWGRFRAHINKALCTAARAGTVDVVAHLHETFRRPGPKCECSPSVGKAAFGAGRVDVLEWLAHVGCDGRHRPGRACVDDAVNKGNGALVEWTVRVAKPWLRYVLWPTIHTLARRNDVPMLDLVARLGLYSLSSDEVAIAAGAGSLDVVRWAAGEPVEGATGAPDGPRVVGWCSTEVAWAAAKRGQTEVVRWLIGHPHATHFVGAPAACGALAKGHCEVVRLLHEAGRTDFGRWNALQVAASSGDLDAVSFVADNGGTYAPKALAAALEEEHDDIIDYLFTRYALGASDVVEAIHIANKSDDADETDALIDWLADNALRVASLWPARSARG